MAVSADREAREPEALGEQHRTARVARARGTLRAAMTDWAAWGTSAGTLVLAGATFAAVRSSNRSARIAERALLAGLRPVLASARPHDEDVDVQFADGRTFHLGAGQPLVREQDGTVYLAFALRNAGAGIATLRSYRLEAEPADRVALDPLGAARHRRGEEAPDPAAFSPQQRDLYVASGDVGFWQAARRDPASPEYAALQTAIRTRGRITVDVLYTDHEGGQAAITRFVMLAGEDGAWRCDVAHHWSA